MRHLDLVAGPVSHECQTRVAPSWPTAAGYVRRARPSSRSSRCSPAGARSGPWRSGGLAGPDELEYVGSRRRACATGSPSCRSTSGWPPVLEEFIVDDCRPPCWWSAGNCHRGAMSQPAGSLHVARTGGEGVASYDEALATAGAPSEPPGRLADQHILYTSGTTGRPKGAMIHRPASPPVSSSTPASSASGQDDVHLAVLPMFHIAAFLAYAHVANGRPGRALGVHASGGLPAARQRARHHDVPGADHHQHADRARGRERHDLHRLRLMIYGGPSISPGALRRRWPPSAASSTNSTD